MAVTEKLTAADSAILESFVLPKYLSRFGDLALDMLVSGPAARVLHVGCRTGFPDLEIYERIENVEILGIDSSPAALERAREKAATAGDTNIEYRYADSLPGDLEPGMFTHALCLHPLLPSSERPELWSALRWLLCAGGQALVALPLRGSFQEIIDLLREYALKYDEAEFARNLEDHVGHCLSLETLSDEFEAAGFDDVDVEVRNFSLSFDSGRSFIEDPVSRLLILPELRSWLDAENLERPLSYVRDAIDKYWSEGKLELTVSVGCASARCP
ncbi:MAG: class I SAM-dependent methyltransferase [Myxococcota bacterium]